MKDHRKFHSHSDLPSSPPSHQKRKMAKPVHYFLYNNLFKIHCCNPNLKKKFRKIQSISPLSNAKPTIVEGTFLKNPSSSLQKEASKIKTQGDFLILYEKLKVYRLKQKTLYEDETSFLISNREKRSFLGFITSSTLEDSTFFESIFWPFFVWEMLSLDGFYLVHSAALQDPLGRGILFPADGRHGKTTLTLSLIRSGYSFISDDMIFLKKDHPILPYPNDFHIDPMLSKHFKELSFLSEIPPSNPLNPKRKVPKERILKLYESKGSPSLPFLKKVDFLLFPTILSTDHSRLEPLSKTQALANLIPTSALVLFGEDNSKEHMECLKNVVEQATCIRFSFGKDLFENPFQIPAFIEKNLEPYVLKPGENYVSLSRG